MYFFTNFSFRRLTMSEIESKSNKQRISEIIVGSKVLKILETALLIFPFTKDVFIRDQQSTK